MGTRTMRNLAQWLFVVLPAIVPWCAGRGALAEVPRRSEDGGPSPAPVGFPAYPPIRDADPRLREKRLVRVPTRVIVEAAPERIGVSVDQRSLAEVEISVGRKMVVGFKHSIFVISEKGKKCISGGFGTTASIGTIYIPRQADGAARPGEKLEVVFALFETDIPVQHEWMPESGKYKELWSRSILVGRQASEQLKWMGPEEFFATEKFYLRATDETKWGRGGVQAQWVIFANHPEYLRAQARKDCESILNQWRCSFAARNGTEHPPPMPDGAGAFFGRNEFLLKLAACYGDHDLVDRAARHENLWYLELARRASESFPRGRPDPIHQAAKAGDVQKVEQLLRENAALLEAKDDCGRTPLFWAAWYARLDIVECLVAKGANVNAADKDGNTILVAAAASQQLTVVELLVNKGAEVNPKTRSGWTPLLAAHTRQDVVDFLISKGADVRAKDSVGRTLLHLIMVRGPTDLVVQSLLAKGLDPNSPSRYGSPLHFAAGAGNGGAVKVLLAAGATVDPRDHRGMTPLHHAARSRIPWTVQLLLAAGADINAKDAEGRTPLAWALAADQDQIARFLREHGAR